MPCDDPYMVHLSIAKAGDESLIWIENSPPGYYVYGSRTVTANGSVKVQTEVEEDQLTRANPLRYVYESGELYIVNLIFDSNAAAGVSAEVHAELRRNGAHHHTWCATVRGGTPDPDFASYAIKGQR
jgi:hypothetical protein